MKILINGKLAALKENTSFEYIADNRLFSGSDGYSLTITFPLRGCSQNLSIFGNINRADVAAKGDFRLPNHRQGTFAAWLYRRDGNFTSRSENAIPRRSLGSELRFYVR